MTEPATGPRAVPWRLVELGLMLRALAAGATAALVARRGVRWLFPDTDIYWQLGRAIRRGAPYEVSQWGVPHFALRAPGYPLFLAACQLAFGDRALPARLVQAVLGAGCVAAVYRLTARVAPDRDGVGRWSPAWFAAALAAVEPYTVGMAVELLSEAVFAPLMLLGLWGLAEAWDDPGWRRLGTAAGAGAAWGAAALVKPSWAPFPPLALAAWVLAADRRRSALAGALVALLAMAAMMAPWWVRNYRVFGRFVPTAFWMGASLYDGWNPAATGGSDMRFLGARDLQPLHEEAQDAVLTARALAFARSHPRRVLELAAIKAARFWSPWPNAEHAPHALPVRLAGAAVTLPVYALALLGLRDCRRDARAWVLLAGPVLYFAAVHLAFVSSIRYRIPAMLPAFGLAGAGAARVANARRRTAGSG